MRAWDGPEALLTWGNSLKTGCTRLGESLVGRYSPTTVLSQARTTAEEDGLLWPSLRSDGHRLCKQRHLVLFGFIKAKDLNADGSAGQV